MTVLALNGPGRIGKLVLGAQLERGARIAWINDAVGDAPMHTRLLEFDTVHGRWTAGFAADAKSVTIGGTCLPFVETGDLGALPLAGVEVVIDCTGAFTMVSVRHAGPSADSCTSAMISAPSARSGIAPKWRARWRPARSINSRLGVPSSP